MSGQGVKQLMADPQGTMATGVGNMIFGNPPKDGAGMTQGAPGQQKPWSGSQADQQINELLKVIEARRKNGMPWA